MCTAKPPKPQPTSQDKPKPVQYLSNPWVDGLGIVGSETRGRNSLRIDPGTPRRPVTVTPPITPEPPISKPPIGRPGYGGGGFIGTGPRGRGGRILTSIQ